MATVIVTAGGNRDRVRVDRAGGVEERLRERVAESIPAPAKSSAAIGFERV